jgi:hypothetical protein
MSTKVLYVAGYERSGSTIFHNVLGQVDKLSAYGEIRQLWHRALLQNRPCGCGVEPLRDCPYWRRVFEEAFGGIENTDPKHEYVYRLRSRNRHFPLLLLPGGEPAMKFRLNDYFNTVGQLYEALGKVGEGQVVVDSSKSPTHAWLLDAVPNLDVYVVHLTRDPRGVLNSILKRKRNGHGGYTTYTPRRTVVEWMMINSMVERLESRFDMPYMRVQYEAFVRSPETVLKKVLQWMETEFHSLPLVNDSTVHMEEMHTAGGSPHRFSTGTVRLQEDEDWKTNLDSKEIELAGWWTRGFRRRYGYSVR